MDYNQKLNELCLSIQQLKNKAMLEGYQFINGKFVKDELIPAIEIYARGKTSHESYGQFAMIHKIIPITQKQLKEIQELKHNAQNIINNFVYNQGILTRLKNINTLYDIFHLTSTHQLNESHITRIVEDVDEEYSCNHPDNKLYLEFFFSDENIDGYISVYDINPNSIHNDYDNNHDDVDVRFEKYLTHN